MEDTDYTGRLPRTYALDEQAADEKLLKQCTERTSALPTLSGYYGVRLTVAERSIAAFRGTSAVGRREVPPHTMNFRRADASANLSACGPHEPSKDRSNRRSGLSIPGTWSDLRTP